MPITDNNAAVVCDSGNGRCSFNDEVYCELVEKVDDLAAMLRNTLSIVKGNYAMLQRMQGYEERLRRLEAVAIPREEAD